MPIAALYIATGMLVLGVLPLPYGYYTLLRIVATAAFAWAAVVAYKKGEGSLPWIFAVAAVLYNPLMPIFLPKPIWMVINLASAALLYVNRAKIADEPERLAR